MSEKSFHLLTRYFNDYIVTYYLIKNNKDLRLKAPNSTGPIINYI
jgi:hypothetical protein